MLITTGSNNGYRFIKRWEGLKLHAYKCSAGVNTIGYGHTTNVREGQVITVEQADRLFENDIKNFEFALNKTLVGVAPVTQNQYDALLSFAFNCGVSAVSEVVQYMRDKGKINKLVNVEETKKYHQYKFHLKNNHNDIFYISVLFCKYISAGGKPVEGLFNRRFEESLLFLDI